MNFLYHIIIMSCLFLFPVLGYNVVFGKGKILHFGQEAQSIVAVYGLWVFVMQYEFSFLASWLIAAALTAALSMLLAWLSFRLEPDGLGVMSIALHLIMIAIVLNWQSVTRGALGIPRIPRFPFLQTMESFVVTVLLLATIWVTVLYLLDRGSFGRKLTAIAEHNWHAGALGISRKRVHMCAFLIAGLGSLLSSTLAPQYLYLLTPSNYHFPVMITIIMMVVAGKPGSILGVTLATVLLVTLKEGLRFAPLEPSVVGPLQLILFGAILFIAVFVRRNTLFPVKRSI